MVCTGIVKRMCCEGRSDAFAAQLFRHFGMHQIERPILYTIFKKGPLILEENLKLLVLLIV